MLSVCIITKNESKNLEKCLSCLKKYDLDIVVVDTGSTDNSVEVAKKYTDSIFFFHWCDDFAAARNFAASKAKNDVIMMIDTDEFVEQLNFVQLKQLIIRNKKKVGRIHRNNSYVSDGIGMNSKEVINRIYDRRLYYYVGKVHEQITARDGRDYDTYIVPVYVEHSGYSGDKGEREKKADRNLKLLKEMLKTEGEDPYVLYQIGKSYYYKGQYQQAAEYFERTFDKELDPKLEYVIDMITSYGYALVNAGQAQRALDLECLSDEFSGSADFIFMMGIVYMQNAMFEQAVQNFLKAAAMPSCVVDGVNSYLAYYNAGVIYECLGDKKKALEYYKKCGQYKKAVEGIARIGKM